MSQSQNPNTLQIIILDTETTGLHNQQPLEVSWLHVALTVSSDGLVLAKPAVLSSWSSYFNVTVPITPQAQAVHGISKAKVAGEPVYKSASQLKLPDTNILCGFNIAYDRRSLHGTLDHMTDLCILKLYRKLYPELPSYKLTSLIQTYFPVEAETLLKVAHSSLGDCKLTLLLLDKVLTDFSFNSLLEVLNITSNS